MRRLLQLIYYYRAFLLFIFLEVVCGLLMVNTNPYHSAAFFTSSNTAVSWWYDQRKGVTDYLNLKEVNEELAVMNARLLEQSKKQLSPIILQQIADSSEIAEVNFPYGYIAAKVINNSTGKLHNHFTLNKGLKHNIKPGMGVINPQGIAGKVKSVSENYATVTSLLNKDLFVSGIVKKTGSFCTVNWDGHEMGKAKVLYLPRHVEIAEGDTIVTSGYSGIFPKDIQIGIINNITLTENSPFYSIDIDLILDFNSLSYVYVITNPGKEEKDSLELVTEPEVN